MDSVAGEERPGLQRNPPNKAGILTFISLWDWTLSPPPTTQDLCHSKKCHYIKEQTTGHCSLISPGCRSDFLAGLASKSYRLMI